MRTRWSPNENSIHTWSVFYWQFHFETLTEIVDSYGIETSWKTLVNTHWKRRFSIIIEVFRQD